MAIFFGSNRAYKDTIERNRTAEKMDGGSGFTGYFSWYFWWQCLQWQFRM